MRRIVLVFLLVLTSMATWASGAVAQNDDLPDAPQAESGGLEFAVESVIRGDTFGAPINFDADEEGRDYVLMAIRVTNTGEDDQKVGSDQLAFVNGEELIGSSGSTSERAGNALSMQIMGDNSDYNLRPGANQTFVVGWRLAVELDELTLNIDQDGADRIDLEPWLEQDLDPDEFRPADIAPFVTRDGSYVLGDTLGQKEGDTQFAATGYQFVEGTTFYQPRGQYVLVSFTLFVTGREANSFNLDSVHLYSASTDQFTDYDFGATVDYNDIGNSLVFEDLQPGITYNGNAVFDVSLEASDFWLTVGGTIEDPLSAIHLDSTGTSGSAGGASSDSQTITDCAEFADYDEAQDYYADNADAQIYLDPDQDGLACEVFFGRG